MRGSGNREFAEALHSLGDVLSFSELVDGVLEPIRLATASSGALLYRYDDSGSLQILGGNLALGISRYISELFAEDPIQQALFGRGVMEEAVVPRLFPEVDWETYRHGAAYHEFYRPNGIEDMLGLTLTDLRYGTPSMSGILLTRTHREPAFDRDILRTMTRARSLLCVAARRVERHTEAIRRAGALETVLNKVCPPTAVFDGKGRVLHASEEVRSKIGSDGMAHLSLIAARAAADANEQTTVLRGSASPPLRATATSMRDGAGSTFVQIVVCECPARRLADSELPAGALLRKCGVTNAEAQVAALVARGLATKDIARNLGRSPSTVRNQLASVFQKMHVANRTELAVLLCGTP